MAFISGLFTVHFIPCRTRLPLKKYTGIALFAALISVNASARASLIMMEDFNYNTGVLAGNNGGTGWNSAWNTTANPTSADNKVTSGSLTYSNLSATGNKVTTVAGNNLTSYRQLSGTFGGVGSQPNTLWFGFEGNLASGSPSGSYGTITLNGGSIVQQFLMGDLPTTNGTDNTKWGFEGGNDPSSATVSNTTVDSTTHFLAYKITFDPGNGRDTVTLYVDPAPGATAPTGGFTHTVKDFTFDTVALQSGTGETNNFDALRMGTLYTDIAPTMNGSVTPEPPISAMMTLGLTAIAAFKTLHRKPSPPSKK